MSLPVSIVKIHHQGGGAPNDHALDPYSVWIGPSGPQLTHSPLADWSTLNLNGVILGICFSGQRQDGIPGDPAWPVTDQELASVENACIQARALGWITATPDVSPHDNLSGSATLCPGTQVYARWGDVVNAVNPPPTPPPKRGHEMFQLFQFSDAPTPDDRAALWVTNGQTRRHITTPVERDALLVSAGSQGLPTNIAQVTVAQFGGIPVQA